MISAFTDSAVNNIGESIVYTALGVNNKAKKNYKVKNSA